ADFEWVVTPLGGADSEQGPYEPGEVEFLDNGFITSATGGDIWSNKLGCTYVHLKDPIKGDFTIVYTIEEHTTDPATTWSKCGVMIAQELDPMTPYIFIQSTCSNHPEALNDKGTKIISRPDKGGAAGPGSNGWTKLKWPVTYKFVRKGDKFTASVSFDRGKNFESIEDKPDGKLDNSEVILKDPVYVGIAINGHNAGQTTGTATVTNIFLNDQDTFAVEAGGKLTTTWARVKAQ
ncbi:hypothetical protein IH992_33835, partial [Candidatus Poribacteria bacterium]|nr:hypothetical protein [Candidatus Poribacteria bacterium]